MSFIHSPEELKNKVIGFYQNSYPSYQAAVNNKWNDGVSLEAIKDVFLGDATKTKEIKVYPTVAVLSGDVFPVQRVEQYRDILWHTMIYIRIFLRNSNLSILEKMLDRSLEAQLQMFEDNPQYNLGGLAKSFEFLRAEPTDSFNPPGATLYIRCIETQWECEHV